MFADVNKRSCCWSLGFCFISLNIYTKHSHWLKNLFVLVILVGYVGSEDAGGAIEKFIRRLEFNLSTFDNYEITGSVINLLRSYFMLSRELLQFKSFL